MSVYLPWLLPVETILIMARNYLVVAIVVLLLRYEYRGIISIRDTIVGAYVYEKSCRKFDFE